MEATSIDSRPKLISLPLLLCCFGLRGRQCRLCTALGPSELQVLRRCVPAATVCGDGETGGRICRRYIYKRQKVSDNAHGLAATATHSRDG